MGRGMNNSGTCMFPIATVWNASTAFVRQQPMLWGKKGGAMKVDMQRQQQD